MVNNNFSIESAEKILPQINTCLSKASELRDEIELYEEDIFDVNQFIKTQLLESREEKCKIKEDFAKYLETINESGCCLHDFNQGIIHFPINFQGKKAVLCWHHKDGKRIKHWHYSKEACDERTKIIDVDEI